MWKWRSEAGEGGQHGKRRRKTPGCTSNTTGIMGEHPTPSLKNVNRNSWNDVPKCTSLSVMCGHREPSFVVYRCQCANPLSQPPCHQWFISCFLNRNLKQGMLQKETKSGINTVLGTTRRMGLPDTGSLAHTRGIPSP